MTYLLIALVVIALTSLALLLGYVVDRTKRARFLASLPPNEREELRGFEMVAKWWHHPHYLTFKRWRGADMVTPWHSPRNLD